MISVTLWQNTVPKRKKEKMKVLQRQTGIQMETEYIGEGKLTLVKGWVLEQCRTENHEQLYNLLWHGDKKIMI